MFITVYLSDQKAYRYLRGLLRVGGFCMSPSSICLISSSQWWDCVSVWLPVVVVREISSFYFQLSCQQCPALIFNIYFTQSQHLTPYLSTSVPQYLSTTISEYSSTSVLKYSSIPVPKHLSTQVPQHSSISVLQYLSTPVSQYANTSVLQYLGTLHLST